MFYVCGGDREVGSILNAWNGVGFQIVGFALLPLLPWLARRVGKRGLMLGVLSLAALGGVAKWFIFSPDLFFDVSLPSWLSDDTLRLHALLLDPLLSGPIWVALGVIVPSMMADLCDVDEYEYGKRREGIFGAVFLWMQKIGFSLTFLFTGLAIWLSGFNERLGADQPENTLFVMRLCFAGFSTLAMLLGMVFLLFYSVSERRAYEVRTLLEQRRGKA
jgi:GPH family glycoside/pentoside/hexuronide:cation symporter